MTNMRYIVEGTEIARKAIGAENVDKIFMKNDRTIGPMNYQGILEQIGRMKLQNHFEEKRC